ncbi:MAG: DNA-binding domain-containing protein [Steroidobacteraceae bacterium]
MELLELQRCLAAHLRDPEGSPPPPDIEDRRLAVYRDLFFNNLRDLLGSTLPVSRALLGERAWSALIRQFFREHRARTPYFIRLAGEFVQWLGDLPTDADRPPCLAELAHYEWMEVALANEPDPDPGTLPPRPRVSALAWLLAYQWPVHRIGPERVPERAPELPTFIVVHRDPQGAVHFLEVDAAMAHLLSCLESAPGLPAEALVRQVCAQLAGNGRPVTEEGTRAALAMLVERCIVELPPGA